MLEERARDLFAGAETMLGGRLAEARFDDDRGLRITVVDLSDADRAALDGLARQLGIESWVRLERADPESLEAWERLRHDLLRLQAGRPPVLGSYPTPKPGYQRPPVAIGLQADAEGVAAELHAAYGDFVALWVGALPYPPSADRPQRPTHRAGGADMPLADAAEMTIVGDGPLTMRSGDTAQLAVLLTDNSGSEICVHTNGYLTAAILDPDSGAVVGGFTGMQHQPLIRFTAAPNETVRIPLLVGTASYDPALGYTVPAGRWHLTALLRLDDGRQLRLPALELTVTD